MKILMINLPYAGHVVPTIGLIQQLIQKGCQVTYLMPEDWQSRISESRADFVGYPNHPQLSEQMKNAWSMAEKIVEDYDLVLYEQFFFLGKHLADKYNKPAVRIFTAPSTNQKLMQEYIQSGPLSIFRYCWIARAFTKDIAKGIPLKTDNWLDEIIENPPQLNLVYTLKEFQPYVDEFDQNLYQFIGPSVYQREKQEFDFIKKDRPIIYISLGTIVKGAVSFFKMCIDAFEHEDVDVIISTGKKFNLNKLKHVPENIHLYSDVPQLQVLRMSDVFVTHGGMNSVSEAFVYQVPQVVIPFSSDQPVNARCVEKLGAGKHLVLPALDSSILKETVFSVMNDAEIKKNLKKIRKLICESAGNEGAAEMIIELIGNRKGE